MAIKSIMYRWQQSLLNREIRSSRFTVQSAALQDYSVGLVVGEKEWGGLALTKAGKAGTDPAK